MCRTTRPKENASMLHACLSPKAPDVPEGRRVPAVIEELEELDGFEGVEVELLSSSSYRVPFSAVHHSNTAHGGLIPAGSGPASVSKRATTPCGGTAEAVKLRTAVPLEVCVQRSWRETIEYIDSVHRVSKRE